MDSLAPPLPIWAIVIISYGPHWDPWLYLFIKHHSLSQHSVFENINIKLRNYVCLFFPEILDLTYDALFHLAPNFTPWMSSQYFSWKERSTNTELLSSILPNFMPLWFYSSYYLCLGSPFSSSFLKSPKYPLWNQSYLSSTEHILGVRDCAKHLQYKR